MRKDIIEKPTTRYFENIIEHFTSLSSCVHAEMSAIDAQNLLPNFNCLTVSTRERAREGERDENEESRKMPVKRRRDLNELTSSTREIRINFHSSPMEWGP